MGEERATVIPAMTRFRSPELEDRLRSTCDEVLQNFRMSSLRLLCFFDDANPKHFDDLWGENHYGFHTPVIGSGTWPAYVESLLVTYAGIAYDNMIYLNGRACASAVGAAITFAHELQHFMQYSWDRKVWAANNLIYQMFWQGLPTTVKPWEIPFEQDTNRVSKRIAEGLFGAIAVNRHVEEHIAAKSNAEKWKAFQSLSYHDEFDLLAETIAWVNRYKIDLLKLKCDDVDLSREQWWA